MNSAMTWETKSTSSKHTEQLAEKLGAKLRGGEVIELVSDLGGGKTTFTRGLVRGAGSEDKVGSPTFTLSREYEAPKFVIAHFDFYRLDEAGIVADELAEVEGEPNYVAVVEWGDIVHDVLPAKRLTVRLLLDTSGEDSRKLLFDYPDRASLPVGGRQMIILAIRTDKPEAEIGLFDGKTKLGRETWQAHRQLAETLHGKIEALLKTHGKDWQDIGGIACFQGPGSFTGLRIGLTVGNTLAYSYDVPIVATQDPDWCEAGIQRLLDGGSDSRAMPFYGADAHITPQKK